MSGGPFLTLAARGEAETRVRGSTFHALAAPVPDEGQVREILEARERAMYDATHHCFAWKLRDGRWRADDAGEPSGSAGAPILAAVMRAVEQGEAQQIEHGYATGGQEGEIEFSVPLSDEAAMADLLRDGTAGALAPERIGEQILYRATGL